jgi:hypothetical protein
MKKTALKVIFLFFISVTLYSQTPGVIYKPANSALGRSILDPNGDGFVSLTSAGFSGTDYGVNSELRMIPLPIIVGEPVNDIVTGSGGGHTDIVSFPVSGNNSRESAYILYKTVNGVDYIIIRMRIGKASTSPKGYSFLIDTDGIFGNQYPSNAKNPGFEREVVLQTGNPDAVVVYSHGNSAPVAIKTYPNNTNTQRSVALSTVSGTPDYFYDFFIEFADLNLASGSQPVGITAVTVTSAGSGISGTISDFNGINDKDYGGDPINIMTALMNTFPPIALTELTEDFNPDSWTPKTSKPTVNDGILTSSTSISGTSIEADGTVITIYKNGVSIGTATVTNNTWTLTGVTGLAAGDLITATALASGKTTSDISNTITVSGALQDCYIAAPVITTRASSQTITGTWSGSPTPNGSNVRIQLYTQTNENTITEFTHSTVYVQANGTWSVATGLANNVFNETNFVAKAIDVSSNCTSGYSNVSIKTSGNASQIGTVTPAPTVTTTPIYQSSSSQTVTVANNGTSAVAAYLILYVNGVEVLRTGSTVAINASHNFSVAGLQEGDVVSARAQGTGTSPSYWLSNVSNLVVVQLNTPSQTNAPTITGTYTSGSGKTITGTSTEPAGTEIKVYKNGVLIGTTTVTIYGTWQLTGQTLATNDVLTATAKATGKSVSGNSNSVTVQASAPGAPTVTGSYIAGNTSISGTGGNTLVRIYVDETLIGTATPSSGNWTLSGLASSELYRGAVIHATNIVNGIESVISNQVTVTGVVSFCITDENGDPLTDKYSGQQFNVKITAKDASGCGASDFTFFQNNANLSSNKWFDPSGASSNFTNGVLTLNNVVLGGAPGSASINAIGLDDPTVTGTATLTILAPAIWVGSISNDFNTAGNWFHNFVPGPNAAIRFASVALDGQPAVRDCHLDMNRIIGDLDFNNSDYKLNLNGKKLELRGQISNSNATTGSWISTATSELEIKGYGNTETLHFATGSEILNLTLNNTSSGALTLGSALAIRGVLNVINGQFNAGNALLTFKSDASKTAIAAPVTGSITGNVNVERYYPAKRAFRFITSSVTTTTTIRANWQEGVNNTSTDYSLNNNPNPGFGTHITGNITSDFGFDRTNTTNSSMFTFNYLTNAWVAVPNTNVLTLTAGEPYRLMLRGDRSIDYNTNDPAPTNTTLRATGALFTGTKTYTFNSIPSGTGYLFIGNPYQSPVDSRKVLRASTGVVPNFFYYWDPRMSTRGAYVTLQHEELEENDIKSISASNISRYIQPGQAAFVRKASNATTASIVFQESFKNTKPTATNTPAVFRNSTGLSILRLELYEQQMYQNQAQPLDGLVIKFNDDYSNGLDNFDAPKFFNQDEDLACKVENRYMSILSNSFPLENEEIQLYTTKYRHQNYTIVAKLSNYDDLVPFIYDAYTQHYHQINSGETAYNFTINASIPATIATDRFKIVFRNVTLGLEDFDMNVTLYPNPTIDGIFTIKSINNNHNTSVSLYNTIGQKVNIITNQTDVNTIQCKAQGVLQAGIYLVVIEQDGKRINKKIIVQ